MQSSRYAVKSPAPPAPVQAEPEPEPFTNTTVYITSMFEIAIASANKMIKEAPIYASDPMMDEFAQTRPPDDLFDDDFTPIADSEPVLDPPPAPAPFIPEAEHIQLLREPPRGPRGRGRGRGGGGSGGGRISPVLRAEAPKAPKVDTKVEDGAAEAVEVAAAPKVERKEGAVRGDRSGTGGIKKVYTTSTCRYKSYSKPR